MSKIVKGARVFSCITSLFSSFFLLISATCEEAFIGDVNIGLENNDSPIAGVTTKGGCEQECLDDDTCSGYSWNTVKPHCRLAFNRDYTLVGREHFDFYTRVKCID